jgi:hypothetical protein
MMKSKAAILTGAASINLFGFTFHFSPSLIFLYIPSGFFEYLDYVFRMGETEYFGLAVHSLDEAFWKVFEASRWLWEFRDLRFVGHTSLPAKKKA